MKITLFVKMSLKIFCSIPMAIYYIIYNNIIVHMRHLRHQIIHHYKQSSNAYDVYTMYFYT